MGADYTSFSIGPVIFFLICAISSVAWLTLSMTIAVKGMVVAPDKKPMFVTLFTVAALFAAFFFFAVMKYEWLGGDTEYDGMYHSIGYLGSMIIGATALAAAQNGNLKPGKLFRYSFGAAIGFLAINAVLSSGYPRGSRGLAYVIGFLYASIQFVVPVLYYFHISKPQNMQLALAERDAMIKYGPNISVVKVVANPASQSQSATIPSHPQPESGDAFQDSNNW